LPNQAENRIGSRLGRVIRNAGAYRIFYQATYNAEKYISLGGIGYICDTEEDALALEKIKENQTKSVVEFVKSAQLRMLSEIQLVNETQNMSANTILSRPTHISPL
jgi:hypothetical protein